jgi:hypothetical protein
VVQRSRWELSFDDTGFDLNGDFVLAVSRVKVRRGVIIPEHRDHNPQESADCWQSNAASAISS